MALRSHEYTMAKGYKESLKGKKVTWTVPNTLAEATQPGPDTNGKPYFPDEAAVVRAAVGQLNIKKGHSISAAQEDSGKVGEKDFEAGITTLAQAEKIGREVVWSSVQRSRTGAGVKAIVEKSKKVEAKVTTNLGTYDKAKLAFLVEFEHITQADMDAELARRTAAKSAK